MSDNKEYEIVQAEEIREREPEEPKGVIPALAGFVASLEGPLRRIGKDEAADKVKGAARTLQENSKELAQAGESAFSLAEKAKSFVGSQPRPMRREPSK